MTPSENTSGRREARKALAESRTASARADRLIDESRELLARVAQRRQENHFTDKFRSILQGGSDERRD